MGLRKLLTAWLFAFLCMGWTGAAWAQPRVHIVVKTILASQGASYVDPDLAGLIKELQPIFRCPSYKLLAQDRMSLRLNETGTALLPQKRVLKVTPLRIVGNRVALQLNIYGKGRQIFETAVQLLNGGTVTVGWPKYKGAALLFNIFGSF